MNSAGKVRSAMYNDRQSSALPGARSHVPFNSLRAQHGESFEGDMTPAESASDIDHESALSSPRKANGFTRINTERRIESRQTSERHNTQTGSKSPMKERMAKTTDKKDDIKSQISRKTGRVVETLPIYPPENENALTDSRGGKTADLG